MKFIFTCLLLLAVTPAVLSLPGNLNNLKTFWASLGTELKIDTSSVEKCYGSLSAPIYWRWVTAETNTQSYLIESQEVNFLAAAAILKGVSTLIGSELDCMLSSHGYANLNKSMTYDQIPSGKLSQYLQVYFFGLAAQNYAEYLPVYNLLVAGNFAKAGTEQAIVYTHQGPNVTYKYAQSYGAGFRNGIQFQYALPFPLDQYDCFDNSTGQDFQNLIDGWTTTAANSTSDNVASNVQQWFTNTGNKLVANLKASFKCLNSASSQQKLDNAVGYQVYSKDLITRFNTFAQKRPSEYLALFQNVRKQLDGFNTLFAGKAFGAVLKGLKEDVEIENEATFLSRNLLN